MFSVTNLTRTKTPKVPIKKIVEYLLPSKYNLTLVYIGDRRSRNLNKKYRNKDKTANILTFSIDDSTGEIFINLAQSTREHKKFMLSFVGYVAFLLIHGILHIKGFNHCSIMEKKEDFILKKFNIK